MSDGRGTVAESLVSDAATVGETLEALTATLAARGIDEPRREAQELIAALHDEPRFWPLTHRDVPLAAAMRARVQAAADARSRGAPLAYAIGRANFRHLTLEVDARVLIPRPETERLVDLVLSAVGGRTDGIAIDVGTGSGAIALALASEGTFAKVYGTDVSLDALTVARANAERLRSALRAPVELHHGSLFDPVRSVRASVIVCNPPYIADGEAAALPPSVRDWEPAVALYSGRDGLDVTRRLVRDAVEMLEPAGWLAIEVDTRRAALVAELVAREPRFESVRVELDFTGRERFVLARRTRGETE